MAYAQSSVHPHEDDLELYIRGRLEPERISAAESHLSACQPCRERLSQCIGLQRIFQSAREMKSEEKYEPSEPRSIAADVAIFQELHPFSLARWRARILDASTRGLGILAPKPVLPGTIVQIRIESTIEIGDVQHCSPSRDKGFQISLRLHSGF
jgi:anti-sigma factor RsiW